MTLNLKLLTPFVLVPEYINADSLGQFCLIKVDIMLTTSRTHVHTNRQTNSPKRNASRCNSGGGKNFKVLHLKQGAAGAKIGTPKTSRRQGVGRGRLPRHLTRESGLVLVSM